MDLNGGVRSWIQPNVRRRREEEGRVEGWIYKTPEGLGGG